MASKAKCLTLLEDLLGPAASLGVSAQYLQGLDAKKLAQILSKEPGVPETGVWYFLSKDELLAAIADLNSPNQLKMHALEAHKRHVAVMQKRLDKYTAAGDSAKIDEYTTRLAIAQDGLVAYSASIGQAPVSPPPTPDLPPGPWDYLEGFDLVIVPEHTPFVVKQQLGIVTGKTVHVSSLSSGAFIAEHGQKPEFKTLAFGPPPPAPFVPDVGGLHPFTPEQIAKSKTMANYAISYAEAKNLYLKWGSVQTGDAAKYVADQIASFDLPDPTLFDGPQEAWSWLDLQPNSVDPPLPQPPVPGAPLSVYGALLHDALVLDANAKFFSPKFDGAFEEVGFLSAPHAGSVFYQWAKNEGIKPGKDFKAPAYLAAQLEFVAAVATHDKAELNKFMGFPGKKPGGGTLAYPGPPDSLVKKFPAGAVPDPPPPPAPPPPLPLPPATMHHFQFGSVPLKLWEDFQADFADPNADFTLYDHKWKPILIARFGSMAEAHAHFEDWTHDHPEVEASKGVLSEHWTGDVFGLGPPPPDPDTLDPDQQLDALLKAKKESLKAGNAADPFDPAFDVVWESFSVFGSTAAAKAAFNEWFSEADLSNVPLGVNEARKFWAAGFLKGDISVFVPTLPTPPAALAPGDVPYLESVAGNILVPKGTPDHVKHALSALTNKPVITGGLPPAEFQTVHGDKPGFSVWVSTPADPTLHPDAAGLPYYEEPSGSLVFVPEGTPLQVQQAIAALTGKQAFVASYPPAGFETVYGSLEGYSVWTSLDPNPLVPPALSAEIQASVDKLILEVEYEDAQIFTPKVNPLWDHLFGSPELAYASYTEWGILHPDASYMEGKRLWVKEVVYPKLGLGPTGQPAGTAPTPAPPVAAPVVSPYTLKPLQYNLWKLKGTQIFANKYAGLWADKYGSVENAEVALAAWWKKNFPGEPMKNPGDKGKQFQKAKDLWVQIEVLKTKAMPGKVIPVAPSPPPVSLPYSPLEQALVDEAGGAIFKTDYALVYHSVYGDDVDPVDEFNAWQTDKYGGASPDDAVWIAHKKEWVENVVLAGKGSLPVSPGGAPAPPPLTQYEKGLLAAQGSFTMADNPSYWIDRFGSLNAADDALTNWTTAQNVNWPELDLHEWQALKHQWVESILAPKLGVAPVQPIPPGPVPPPPPSLKFVLNPVLKKSAHQLSFQGAHQKWTLEDQHSNKWMFKPIRHPNKEAFRSEGEHAAQEILRRIGMPASQSQIVEIDGKRGMAKLLLDAKRDGLSGLAPADLTAAQRAQMFQTHVASWLLSDHDGHEGNFLVLPDDTLVGIDRGQAFKFVGKDKLDLSYSPAGNFGEPYYYRFWRDYESGKHDLDLHAADALLDRIEALPDAEYLSMLEPYVTGRAKQLGDRTAEDLLAALLKRKQSMRKDWEGFLTKRAAARGVDYVPGAPGTGGGPPPVFLAPSAGAPPGSTPFPVSGVVRPIDASLAAQIVKLGHYGQTVFVPGDEFEHGELHIHEEIDTTTPGAPQRRLIITGQTIDKGDSILAAALAGEDPKVAALRAKIPGLPPAPAPPSASGTPFPPLVHTQAFTRILNAVKTVNYHVKTADFAYNQDSLDQAEALRPQLAEWVADPSAPVSVGMPAHMADQLSASAAYYLDALDKIKASAAANEKYPGTLAEQLYLDPDSAKHFQEAMVAHELAVQGIQAQKAEIEAQIAEVQKSSTKLSSTSMKNRIQLHKKIGPDGRVEKSGNEPHAGNRLVSVIPTDHGPATLSYIPWASASEYSWKGFTEVSMPWTGKPEEIQAALSALSRAGVETRPATADEVRLTYFRVLYNSAGPPSAPSGARRAGQSPLVRKAGARAVKRIAASPALTPKEEADIWQQELQKDLGRVIEPWEWQPSERRSGSATGAQGYRPVQYRLRGDAPEDLKTHWNGHVLHHSWSHGADIKRAMRETSMGLPTTERLRVGIGLSQASGASSSSDLGTGGGKYVYTRIKRTGSLYPENIGMLISPRAAYRLGAYIHNHDAWGKKVEQKLSWVTPSTEEISQIAGHSGNETDVRYGVSFFDDLEAILVPTSQKAAIIQAMRDGGLPEVIRGVPLEARVLSSTPEVKAFIAAYPKSVYSWEGVHS